MLNGTLDNVRHALAACEESHGQEQGYALEDAVRALLNELAEPTNVQALALARLMRDRPNVRALNVHVGPFDLPNGYWQVNLLSDPMFTCGIAPDGSVSS